MGNYFSKKNYCRIDATKIGETPFSDYTEVSSTLRNTQIESVTDETCGSASSLLKIEEPSTEFVSVQEESRDGWIVRRHVDIASVTLRLCETAYIFGFDIDTTGFKNICPTYARIEGLKTSNEEWITLVNTESLTPNGHNFFQKNNNDDFLYSHIRLTISPGGGIARFRTYGDIVLSNLNPETEYNLASASLGARIVHRSDTDGCNEPNVLLDNGTLTTHGWLTPRSRKTDRNDFIVIYLAASVPLDSIIIDTTGFKGNSPLKIHVEGCDSNEDDPYLDGYTQWFSLVPESPIKEDALNTFQVPYTDVVSHVRLTLLPDGGLQQIKCIATIPNNLMDQYHSAKSSPSMASYSTPEAASPLQEIITIIDTPEEASPFEVTLDSDIDTRDASMSSSTQEETSLVSNIEELAYNQSAASISYFNKYNDVLMTPSSSQGSHHIPLQTQESKQTPLLLQGINHSPPTSQEPSRTSSLTGIDEENNKELTSGLVVTVEEETTMESLFVCNNQQYNPTPMEIVDDCNKSKKRKMDDTELDESGSSLKKTATSCWSHRLRSRTTVPVKVEEPDDVLMSSALAGPVVVKKGRRNQRKAKN